VDGAARVGLAAIALAACGASPRSPAATVLARGTLAYAVAAAGDRVVSIELDDRFALLVRKPDDARVLGRIDLGPPERDLPALAAAGDRAWVGGADGQVRAVDLARGAVVATWPVGAAVTALAAAGDWVAIGDAAGVLCLRRADDGALVQCAVAAAAPIAAIGVERGAGGEVLRVLAGGQTCGWRLPALARVPGAAPGITWGGGQVVVRGRTVELVRARGRQRLLTLAGAVRAIAIAPGGGLAVAAWVTTLDDPSLVVLAPVD